MMPPEVQRRNARPLTPQRRTKERRAPGLARRGQGAMTRRPPARTVCTLSMTVFEQGSPTPFHRGQVSQIGERELTPLTNCRLGAADNMHGCRHRVENKPDWQGGSSWACEG